MEVYIISGTSKGLGQALSKRLHESGNRVFGLSRSKGGTQGLHLACDLSRPVQISSAMDRIFEMIDLDTVRSVCLVNNAADINPIVPTGQATAEEIDRSLRINLSAPAILTSIFINRTKAFGGDRKIVNITSNAARESYFGLSLYCVAKAGLEQLGRCVALEQESCECPAKIISIDPGIMDTSMQEIIRSTSAENFPTGDRYRKRHENKELLRPESVADFVVECLHRDDLVNGGRYAFTDRK